MTFSATKSPATSHRAEPASNRAAHAACVLLLALVAWLLGAGRWGSYAGLPSHHLFVSDVALILAVLLALPRMWSLRVALGAPGSLLRREWLTALLLLLLVWTAVRLLMHPVTATALRDAAPYLYAVAALHVAIVGLPSRRVTEGILGAAFLFHAGWVTASLISPPRLPANDLSKVVPFVLRGDFDATVCGIAAAATVLWISARGVRSGIAWSALAVLFIAWNIALALDIGSRAGLLAAVVALVAAVALVVSRQRQRLFNTRRRRWLSIGAAVVLAAAAAAVLAVSPAGTRLVHGFDLSPPSGVSGSESSGTARARQVVWSDVLHYVEHSSTRTAVGVGFGPDFLKASGGLDALQGSVYTGVRAPHDFWLNTWARMGLVGLVLTVALAVSAVARAAARAIRARGAASVLPGSVLALLLAVPVAASLGVILESPFGAIPYFWALGCVLRHAGADRP